MVGLNPFVNQVFSVSEASQYIYDSLKGESQSLRESGLFRRVDWYKSNYEDWK